MFVLIFCIKVLISPDFLFLIAFIDEIINQTKELAPIRMNIACLTAAGNNQSLKVVVSNDVIHVNNILNGVIHALFAVKQSLFFKRIFSNLSSVICINPCDVLMYS